MGKCQQFVRVGLQRGLLPFGTAVKVTTRWNYYISPKLFWKYVGGDEPQEGVFPAELLPRVNTEIDRILDMRAESEVKK